MTQAQQHITPLAPTPVDDGILARVPGQYVVQAAKSLPDPACAVEDELRVEVDAAWLGRVRLTFRKQRYSKPKGKTSYVSWLCRHAEGIAASAQAGRDEPRHGQA